MQRPRAVLAGTPGEQQLGFHGEQDTARGGRVRAKHAGFLAKSLMHRGAPSGMTCSNCFLKSFHAGRTTNQEHRSMSESSNPNPRATLPFKRSRKKSLLIVLGAAVAFLILALAGLRLYF